MFNKEKRQNFRAAVSAELREHKSSFIVFSILRALVIAVMIHQVIIGEFENVYLCLLTLLLLFVPSIVQVHFKIELPPTLEIIILCFIYAAEILGTINSFYVIIPFWDVLLHTINGFLAAAIGYSLIWLLNNNDRQHINLSPLYLCLVAFCFSMTIGVIWEFFEYGLDLFFNMNTQRDTLITTFNSGLIDPANFNGSSTIKDINSVVINGTPLSAKGYIDIGLIDTIEDMFVNLVGALVFSIFGFFYARSKTNKHVEHFIPLKKEKHRNYLEPENRT